MWLYHVVEWMAYRENGIRGKYKDVKERHKGIVCRHPDPNEGIRLLREYSDKTKGDGYSNTYVVEYRLLGITKLEGVDPGLLTEQRSDTRGVEICGEISREIVDAAGT